MQTVNSLSLPPTPSGNRAWLTASAAGAQLLNDAYLAAQSDLSIYIGGETGVGKEVLSRLIHAWSKQRSGPIVPIHCGALPLGLAESELFGHVKGAYTGADSHRPGALLQAHGGTLFLDEVGDLPLEIQVKLLRFLENGEIRAVGSDRLTRAQVRIICATHHPLESLVEQGRFRRDLYFRIASVPLTIPPLRDRPEDIRLLAGAFAKEFGLTVRPSAVSLLEAHAWPGNARELRHVLERASEIARYRDTSEISREHLRFFKAINPAELASLPLVTFKEMERLLLIRALEVANGHRGHAAKRLGIARSTLFEMLKRHKINGRESFHAH